MRSKPIKVSHKPKRVRSKRIFLNSFGIPLYSVQIGPLAFKKNTVVSHILKCFKFWKTVQRMKSSVIFTTEKRIILSHFLFWTSFLSCTWLQTTRLFIEIMHPYVLMIVRGKISIATRPKALEKIWPLFCPSLLNLNLASEAIHSRLEAIWIPPQYSREKTKLKAMHRACLAVCHCTFPTSF